MCPWARERGVKMIAARFGGKSPLSYHAGAAVGSDEIVVGRSLPNKMTILGTQAKLFAGNVLPPRAVDEQTHCHLCQLR